jgi:pimeloyl-ACP methyl ester carboxylesterase
LGLEQADFFGYSVGAGVALQMVIRHPEQVRKLIMYSGSYNSGGLHPETLMGSPYQVAYAQVRPDAKTLRR